MDLQTNMIPNQKKDVVILVNSLQSHKTVSAGKKLQDFAKKEKRFLSLLRSLSEQTHKWKNNLNWTLIEKLPYFMVAVSIIQILIHYLADERFKRLLMYDTENKMEVWRFLSYMFLHTDSVHLGINIFIQAFLGFPLEFEQGHWSCAGIYFGGGLAGSLGISSFACLSLMAGASGGIYALLIAQIPNIVLNYETIKYAGYRLTGVLTLTTSDVIYVLYHNYVYNNEIPKIGWAAHFSGGLSGLLLGFIMFKGTSKWRTKLQSLSAAFLFTILVLILINNLVK